MREAEWNACVCMCVCVLVCVGGVGGGGGCVGPFVCNWFSVLLNGGGMLVRLWTGCVYWLVSLVGGNRLRIAGILEAALYVCIHGYV